MDRITRELAHDVLSRQGWLSCQPEAFRQELFRWAVAQHVPAGTVIYRLNDPPGGLYGVVSGAVAISRRAGGGDARLPLHGTVGGWIGVAPFLTGGPREAGLRAAADCVLMQLPLAAMEAMAARDPAAIRAFAQIALAELDAALDLAAVLTLPTAERRIAGALLRAARSGVEPVPLTQADLAALANVSLRQVSGSLRVLARAGLIEPGYRVIRICDPEGLRLRAEERPPAA